MSFVRSVRKITKYVGNDRYAYAFSTWINQFILYGRSKKMALEDCVEYFEHLCRDARSKDFSKDSEFYDLFIKVISPQQNLGSVSKN